MDVADIVREWDPEHAGRVAEAARCSGSVAEFWRGCRSASAMMIVAQRARVDPRVAVAVAFEVARICVDVAARDARELPRWTHVRDDSLDWLAMGPAGPIDDVLLQRLGRLHRESEVAMLAHQALHHATSAMGTYTAMHAAAIDRAIRACVAAERCLVAKDPPPMPDALRGELDLDQDGAQEAHDEAMAEWRALEWERTIPLADAVRNQLPRGP